MIELRSELALRVYRQVFLGIDKPLGYTLDRDEGAPFGVFAAVQIPDGVRWYVRHNDDRLPDSFIPALAKEVSDKAIPGLSLASCRQLSDAGFEPLKELGHLETLDLFNTKLTDEGLRHLAGLKNLRSLNLAGTQVTNKSIEILKGFPQLEKLHLGWTQIDDAGLAGFQGMSSLRVLELRSTRVTDAGMRQLAQLRQVDTLGLQETEIGDSGVASLKPLAATLVRLYLGYTRITDACVNDLRTFTKLRTLMLRATHVNRESDGVTRELLSELGGVGTGPEGIQEGLIR